MSTPPPFFPRALRGSLAALLVDGAGYAVYLGLSFAGSQVPPSDDGVPSPLAMAIDGLFWCSVALVLLGAPIAAALGARSVVPREHRHAFSRTVLTSCAALPVVLLGVPPFFLGHIIVDQGFYVAYFAAFVIVRALAHGGLAALGAGPLGGGRTEG